MRQLSASFFFFRMQQQACNLTEVRKTRLLRHFILKMIILPRQARDKHRENSKQRRVFVQVRGLNETVGVRELFGAETDFRFEQPFLLFCLSRACLGKAIVFCMNSDKTIAIRFRCSHSILKMHHFTKTGSGQT